MGILNRFNLIVVEDRKLPEDEIWVLNPNNKNYSIGKEGTVREIPELTKIRINTNQKLDTEISEKYMSTNIEKELDLIKSVCNRLLSEGWQYAKLGIKARANPREENGFAVATLHKFDQNAKFPCIIEFKSSPVGGEIEISYEFPPELAKYKYLPEYTNILRQFKAPIAKGIDHLQKEIDKNINIFYSGYLQAYSLYKGEEDVKKLKGSVIKRLASIFKLDLGDLNPDRDEHYFNAEIVRKSIGATITLTARTDKFHNIDLVLKNLNEEEAAKILSFLHKKNARI